MTIKLASRIDFEKLFKYVKDIPGEAVTIEISDVFLEPIHVLVLASVILEFRRQKKEVKISSSHVATEEYLAAIRIQDLQASNAPFLTVDQFGAIPIITLKKERMQSYVQMIQQFFQAYCPGKDLTMLEISLAELLNNAYDHAESPIGPLVFCQYYPKIKCIKIAVADLGIGIGGSVNRFLAVSGSATLDDQDAIKWAIEKNRTVQSQPNNRGWGLDTLKEFITDGGHSWFLYSGSGALSLKDQELNVRRNPLQDHFGTMAQLNIFIDQLPEREEGHDDSGMFG